jgi:hypothetical protein
LAEIRILLDTGSALEFKLIKEGRNFSVVGLPYKFANVS